MEGACTTCIFFGSAKVHQRGWGRGTGREKRKKHVFFSPPLSPSVTLTLTSTFRDNISTLLNLLIDRHGSHGSKNINKLLLHAPKYTCATSYGNLIASKHKIKGKKVWLVSINDFVNHKKHLTYCLQAFVSSRSLSDSHFWRFVSKKKWQPH